MTKHPATSILVAALALAPFGYAAAVDSPKSFLSDAIQDSRAEVQMAQLALQKSQQPEVKQFAQQMIRDHNSLDQRLEALARAKNVKLPDGVSLAQKASYEKLAHTDDNFDKDFMDRNVSNQEDDLKKFTDQANSGRDPEVKALAAQALPKFQEHLKLAKALDEKMRQR